MMPFFSIRFNHPWPTSNRKTTTLKQVMTLARASASTGVYKVTWENHTFADVPLLPHRISSANGAPKLPARSINSANGSPDIGRKKAVIQPHATNHHKTALVG